MEISKQKKDGFTELKITGRLDAYWADHLSKEVDQIIRDGSHQLKMDLSDLEFISSAGIGVLLKFHNTLSDMNGSFSLSSVSEPVKKIIDLIGLDEVLSHSETERAEQKEPVEMEQAEIEGNNYKVYAEDATDNIGVECRLIGQPSLLNGARFFAGNSRTIKIPETWFGLGLGCLGNEFNECQNRFGEFITTSGITAYLPTDGTNVPDYMIPSGGFVPELCLLYGLFFSGEFSNFIRFDIGSENSAITFSRLIFDILKLLKLERAAITLVVENEGLVGTSLKTAPVLKNEEEIPFKHPEVRKWLSFTSERAYQQNNALITGIVDRSPEKNLRSFVRPVDSEGHLFGHFHASVFPYHPLKIGHLQVDQITQRLYETETLQSVLHLLSLIHI